MVKRKGRDELEELRGENRQLKKQVKSLRRELDKAINSMNYKSEPDNSGKTPRRSRENKCPECPEGVLELMKLSDTLQYMICKKCDYRVKK